MSTQQNEMGAWFFLRIRGGLEEWEEIRIGQSTTSGKMFFKFSWARKHQKRLPFPHAWAFHLPLMILIVCNVFGSQSSFKQEAKPLWVWTLGDSLLVWKFVFISRIPVVWQFVSFSRLFLSAGRFFLNTVCVLIWLINKHFRFWFSSTFPHVQWFFSFPGFSWLLVVFCIRFPNNWFGVFYWIDQKMIWFW